MFRGGLNSDCKIGYSGPLCQSCTEINGILYSKGGGTICEPCKPKAMIILILIVLLLVFLIMFLLFIR